MRSHPHAASSALLQRAIILATQSDDAGVLTYACGCLQNLCDDDEWARTLAAHGVSRRLEELLGREEVRVDTPFRLP